MAKNILGVDIGSDNLKLVLVNKGQVKKAVTVPVPESLVKEYRVVSVESMGELIRETMKKHGIHCKEAAIVLANEAVFVRSVSTPVMTADQLTYNLPFEFRDYITDELKDYMFDYAMISTPQEIAESMQKPEKEEEGEAESPLEEDEGTGAAMELLAVAVPASLVQDSRTLLRKAGLKMVKAAPTVSSYISLIRAYEKKGDHPEEYCILDLGHEAIRMYMFRGERHVVTRGLEVGLATLDQALADTYNVDIHLAHTYLLNNYDDCQNKEACRNAYNSISVELMRALNFYRFSNPDSQINDVWLCGGGAAIAPLRRVIADTLDMQIHQASELLPHGGDRVEDSYELLQAVGVTLE